MPTKTFFNLKTEKREKIIEVALNEFAAKPYHKVNVTDIIKLSGIARGSFYQYFDNLGDLYSYLISYGGEIKQKYIMAEMGEKEPSSLREYLNIVYKGGLKYSRAHPEYAKLFSFMVRDSSQDETMQEQLKKQKELSIQIFVNLIETYNALPDASQEELRFTAFMLTQINIAFVDYFVDGLLEIDNEEVNEAAEKFIDKLFYGFLKEEV
jgi:AcrR family transcriptional regulator